MVVNPSEATVILAPIQNHGNYNTLNVEDKKENLNNNSGEFNEISTSPKTMKQTLTMAPSMNQNGENELDHDFENLLTEIQGDNGLSISPDMNEKKRKEANKSEAIVAPILS